MFQNKAYLLPKKKETPPDQPQPSFLRANPSASVKTTPNRNCQQSLDFATFRNSTFTAQGESKTTASKTPAIYAWSLSFIARARSNCQRVESLHK